MRAVILFTALACTSIFSAAIAQTPPASQAAPTHYTTADTDIGTLLDDPAAKAILDKYAPGFTSEPQVDMARSMTLKSIQQYAPDRFSDKVLSDIDAALAKLPVKK
jgi:hypothetical protein